MKRFQKRIVLVLLALLCITGLAFAGGAKAAEEEIVIAYTGFPGGLTPFIYLFIRWVRKFITRPCFIKFTVSGPLLYTSLYLLKISFNLG